MENDEHNKLLLRVKDMLINSFGSLKEVIASQNAKLAQSANKNMGFHPIKKEASSAVDDKASSAQSMMDAPQETEEEMIEEEEDDDEDQQGESMIQNCHRILRFQQLLTENHH